jgi:MFS family permease
MASPEHPNLRSPVGPQIRRLGDISGQQWKSGLAAWLGWLFDGLDMHLYTLVAARFVAQLIEVSNTADPDVKWYSSWIQAAFLIGWALGGGFFGLIGDHLGRARALSLTILTYALFTGLSFFAQTWWELMIFRFVAALGIGGEWAVGAALLSETWPRHWRPWIAAVLQTGVNIGVLLAAVAVYVLAAFEPRWVFLVGVVPALLVLWIRRAVPEPEEWHAARAGARQRPPGIQHLFEAPTRRTTILTILVCSLTLTAHWAFLFWFPQHLQHLHDTENWSNQEKQELVSMAMFLVIGTSIGGNFLAGWLAKILSFKSGIALMCVGYGLSLVGVYAVPHGYVVMLMLLPIISFFHGIFALFTMYLPPLFPTLLRTTGAGFCYNIGRIAAAFGTVFFGLMASVGDYRSALFFTGFLFVPALVFALFLPEPETSQLKTASSLPDARVLPSGADDVEVKDRS